MEINLLLGCSPDVTSTAGLKATCSHKPENSLQDHETPQPQGLPLGFKREMMKDEPHVQHCSAQTSNTMRQNCIHCFRSNFVYQ